MEKVLEILEAHIKKLRPEFYDSLNASLTDHDIQRFENQYDI